MADQVSRGWYVPYCEIVGCIDTCCGELPTHVHIAATDGYGSDIWVRTTHTATKGRPTAPVPFGYTACRYPTCCGEDPTRVHIAAIDTYCIDVGRDPATDTATEGRPYAAVPFGYVGCC